MVDVITACRNLKPSQVPLAHRTCAEAAAAAHAVCQQLRGQEPASQLQPMPRLSSTPTQAPPQPGPAHASCPHHLPDQPPSHPSKSQLQGSSQHHPALSAPLHLPGLSILTRPATNPVTSPAKEQQPIIHTTEEQDEQTMPPSMPKQQQDWATARPFSTSQLAALPGDQGPGTPAPLQQGAIHFEQPQQQEPCKRRKRGSAAGPRDKHTERMGQEVVEVFGRCGSADQQAQLLDRVLTSPQLPVAVQQAMQQCPTTKQRVACLLLDRVQLLMDSGTLQLQPDADGSVMLTVRQYGKPSSAVGSRPVELLCMRVSLSDAVGMLNKQMPEYIKHHRLAHHQLQVFREHREAVKAGKDGKVVISCDWSEKLTVERSVEIMSEHWHAAQIGILVACAYFKNKEGAYYEQTVYVMTDGKEQSAAITQAAVNQVVCYLLAEHDMDMRQLYMWSDGCAGQFKGAPAMRQHWGMAQRFSVPVWWSYGATAHFKGRHDSEGGVVKQWLRGIQVEWSQTACACAQCMTPAPRGECVRPSITKPFVAMPMFDQKRDDKHWDDECLTLLCSFAPDSVMQLCTLGKKLSVKMLNEYCKAVGLHVPAGTLRADLRYMVLQHLNEQAECD
ncbi:hypothetical protein QJQ45_002667 [Haematococcus lacustris]|nr:hypothetical protein QJQ45_002667 [Haematococcus lacustris]